MRPLWLLSTAGLTLAIALAACTEEADENGASPSPSPSGGEIPTPIPLALGTSATGTISAPGERDLYALTIDVPFVELDLDADGVISGNRLDARLVLYDVDGTIARVIDDGTTLGISPPRMRDPFALLELPVGTYHVAVEDALGDGGASGFEYVLTARAVTPTVKPGGDSCNDIVLLTNMNGVFEGTAVSDMSWSMNAAALPCVGSPVPGQDHVFRAVLTSGVTYQIVETTTTWDGALYVATACSSGVGGWDQVDVQASCRAGADGSEGADGVIFKPNATGTYFIHVDGVVPDATGLYRLHVRTVP